MVLLGYVFLLQHNSNQDVFRNYCHSNIDINYRNDGVRELKGEKWEWK